MSQFCFWIFKAQRRISKSRNLQYIYLLLSVSIVRTPTTPTVSNTQWMLFVYCTSTTLVPHQYYNISFKWKFLTSKHESNIIRIRRLYLSWYNTDVLYFATSPLRVKNGWLHSHPCWKRNWRPLRVQNWWSCLCCWKIKKNFISIILF